MIPTFVNDVAKSHRTKGSDGDIRQYAVAYLEERLRGFDKDVKICLTGKPSDNGSGLTYAYFPALLTCCAMLELLGNLYVGETRGSGWRRAIKYSGRFLDNRIYSNDNIILLFQVLRHPAAHMNTLSGVRKPGEGHYQDQRITWKIYADARYPAIKIKREAGVLKEQPPWDCPHDYRLYVRLDRLRYDIRDSVLEPGGYLTELLSRKDLLRKFEKCMKQIYPP